MQQKKSRGIILLCLFFFHSVPNGYALGIDFIEKVSFHEDGSGLFSIKVDLIKSNDLIALIKHLNKDYKDIAKRIGYNSLCAAQEKCKNIPDISEIRVKHNDKMRNFTLKFKFKHIKALNMAMQEMNKGIDPPKITYFSLSDELFVREDMNGIARKLIFYQQHDNCLIKSLDLISFFKGTTYTTIYTFHKKIEHFSNVLSQLTKDKKTLQVTHYVFAPDETEASIGNRVHFEKK